MALLDVAGILDEFNLGPLTVKRPAAPTQNEFGGWDPGVESEIVVDPIYSHTASGEDLELLPEGDTKRETRRYGARVPLLSGDRIVDVDGTFRVLNTENLSRQGGVYLVLAQREDDEEAGS